MGPAITSPRRYGHGAGIWGGADLLPSPFPQVLGAGGKVSSDATRQGAEGDVAPRGFLERSPAIGSAGTQYHEAFNYTDDPGSVMGNFRS